MLNREHGDLQTPLQDMDQNTYLLSEIGKFKVVIAYLPMDENGSSSAATMAKDILNTFPKIRVGLPMQEQTGVFAEQMQERHLYVLGCFCKYIR